MGTNKMTLTHFLAVGIMGAVGAILRWLTSVACVKLLGEKFVYGTLTVNVIGCFALGFFMTLVHAESVRLPILAHPAIAIGLLGAFTTFSTFGYETFRYLEQGAWMFAAGNIVANIALGLTAVGLGIGLGKMWT